MTNIQSLFADQEQDHDFDEPSPPSQEEIALWQSVEGVILELDHALDDQVPIRVGMALHEVRTGIAAANIFRPSREDVDRMLQAVERARPHVVLFLSAHTFEANAKRGMDALQGLICRWGEAPEVQAARHPHVALDISAYAEIFRRELRNADAMQAIGERAKLRRSDRAAAVWRRLNEGAA
ncbi:hypothetical protein FV222_06765 [Methylobacterium sp. WL103]|uniref:hypothetical protein n=1 Tax=Methylobacterium sp. WL103 TaxID=2603891 RepID=UPI0011C7470A|nr:hypothetical protein [Methylobacterium sp. WL103]TXN05312.1 hypothetical protein FV222_06765 [Methylobacterium sp. WL103]